MNEVIINGVVYIPKEQNLSNDLRIVVLQRGWVYIGKFNKGEDGVCTLSNSSCIRIWGTKNGLQELVAGPTKDTKLDKCNGDVQFDWLTVIHTIKVNKEIWKEHLK